MTRLRPTLIAALVLAVVGVLLTGCGSDSSSSSTSTPAASTPAASNTTGGAAAPASGGVPVAMKNIVFDPKDVTVHVGQKVTWTNDDTVDHNVTADSGAKFASDNFGKGGTYSFTPTKAGKIAYECTIHPGMVGTLDVVK